jgi:hypothetical protein
MTARVSRARPAGLVLAAALAALATGCTRTAARPWVHPTRAEWERSLAELSRLRGEGRKSPYVETIATTLRDPVSGRVMDGRGGVAVSPGEAVRMILVGGAGATVLDAWVTRRRWRIAVPLLEIVRRGGSEDPSGLPVGFLRWWFIAALEGTPFAASPAGDLWLLRDGDAVVDLRLGACGRGRLVSATRRVRGRSERVDECRLGPGPGAGDSVHYVDETRGLEVDVRVQSVAEAPEGGEAFRDPDLDEGARP